MLTQLTLIQKLDQSNSSYPFISRAALLVKLTAKILAWSALGSLSLVIKDIMKSGLQMNFDPEPDYSPRGSTPQLKPLFISYASAQASKGTTHEGHQQHIFKLLN